ncbi:MAG: hypothetical protein K8R53_15620 [Bacteroidales bacterium]|nr:hypothetical protein [Bacteroidales bacterium]
MEIKNILLIIVLLISICPILGCSKKESKLKSRIEVAEGQIHSFIESNKRVLKNNPKNAAKIYSITALEKGLGVIDSKSFLQCPVLLRVIFSSMTRKGCPPVCDLFWLEDGLNAKGIVVIDNNDKKYEFDNVFIWTQEEKEFFKSTICRFPIVLVIIDKHQKWIDPKMISEYHLPLIRLPLNVFRGKLKVGLIMQDGSHTELIDAYIPPGFLDPCSLNQ